MIEYFKTLIRGFLVKLPIKITQNQWYDYCTNAIIRKSLYENSNCVDVGCHKGEVLDSIIDQAPHGKHFGFEPIPQMYKDLKDKYSTQNNIAILPYALSDKEGQASFNYVKSNPAYSGLVKRSYDHKIVIDEQISVNRKLLDDCIPEDLKIDLIKIDVEGGEMGVLKGSRRILEKDKPLLIFEHGLGASEHYGTTPTEFYGFLEKYGYQIFLLESYLKNKNPLSQIEFEKQFYQKLNYYFIALSAH